MSHEKFKVCIDACLECATICNHCSISCLNESDVKNLTRCIQLNLECAAICRAAAELMSLGSNYAREICNLCSAICEACAAECEKHSHMQHCKECADVCKKCADACRNMK